MSNLKERNDKKKANANSWGVLKGLGETVQLQQDVFNIGRSTRCQLVLNDSLIPSMSAQLKNADQSSTITCLSGTVMLNGFALSKNVPTSLENNDVITLSGRDVHTYSFSCSNKRVKLDDSTAPLLSGRAKEGADEDEDDEVPALTREEPAYKIERKLPALPSKRVSFSSSLAKSPVFMEAQTAKSSLPKPYGHTSVKADELREEFSKMVLKPEENMASFDNFPYHITAPTKDVLLDSVSVYLKQPDLEDFVSNLSISRTIALEGPYGSELYQVELVKALAKQENVSLLLFENPHPILFPDSSHSAANEEEGAKDSLHSALLPSRRLAIPPFSALSSSKLRLKKGDRVRYICDDVIDSRKKRKGKSLEEEGSSKGPEVGMVGEVVLTFDEDNRGTVGVRFDEPFNGGVSLGGVCDDGYGFFVSVTSLRLESEDHTVHELEGLAIDMLLEVASKNSPCIVCIRDIEGIAFASYTRYKKFQKAFDSLAQGVVIIGLRSPSSSSSKKNSSSQSYGSSSLRSSSSLMDFSFLDHIRSRGNDDSGGQSGRSSKMLQKLLPTRIALSAPTKNPELIEWKKSMEEDVAKIRLQSNRAQLKRLMEKNNLCADVESVEIRLLQSDILSVESVEQVLGWAVGYDARTRKHSETAVVSNKEDKKTLSISVEAINHALKNHKESEDQKSGEGNAALKDVVTDNEFEKKILSDVIPSSELNVSFNDIGALDTVKNTLKELVMLPLTRPELFRKGNLTKPTKGVLLFGPPGTGKTMLAKAVATECKANFINVSMASISSKWFGEGEKFAQAIFTVASKIAPSVIFIDEVDSILGKRDKQGEHEAMRKIKNTMMSMWDGLTTSETERVIVLAATNRPFDLDDAVLRRLPRRMLVDLPDASQREQILKVICQKEDLPSDFDYAELAKNTDGYSGSDLRNLCVAAAYIPIREFLDGEASQGLDPHRVSEPDAPDVEVRKLRLDDFLKAKDNVSTSVSEDAVSISELRQWNELYGLGGDRKRSTLSYYM